MEHLPGTTTIALERLAEALDPDQYSAAIVRHGIPYLRVANRRASQLSEDIYAGRGWYWYSWAERIAACDDPGAAAGKVARVLRTEGVAR